MVGSEGSPLGTVCHEPAPSAFAPPGDQSERRGGRPEWPAQALPPSPPVESHGAMNVTENRVTPAPSGTTDPGPRLAVSFTVRCRRTGVRLAPPARRLHTHRPFRHHPR